MSIITTMTVLSRARCGTILTRTAKRNGFRQGLDKQNTALHVHHAFLHISLPTSMGR